MNTVDYIIIGSGAGGSAAAYRLAQSGRQVLLIEKGGRLPQDGTTLDLDKVIHQGAFKSKEPWLNGKGRRFVPEEYFNLGGKTKWYGAALLRYAAEEFEAEREFGCLPWPISYAELAPYYTEAEALFGVREFAIEPDLKELLERMQHDGSLWRVEPLPLGLAPEILEHAEEAKHFDGFASVKGLKADAEQALLERVSTRDNLKVLTGQPVSGLLGAEGVPRRITGVVVQNGQRFEAKTVLLAAGAMHSPRLLQRYVQDTGLTARLPSARLIGGHYKRHLLTALLALSATRKTDLLRKTALLLNARFPHSSIQPLGFDGELIGTLLPRFVPSWLANAFGQRAYGFFLQTEEGSDENNRVIAEVNEAQYPKLDYDPARLPLAVSEHRRMTWDFRRALLRAGYLSFVKPIPLEGTAHACGTLVAGSDPQASVVDGRGKVYGLENLYVVDGSVLPRISRVNPSLTIYAWALWVAHHLLLEGEVR